MRNLGRVLVAGEPAQRRYDHERHGPHHADHAAPEDRRLVVRRPAQVADRLAPELLWDGGRGHGSLRLEGGRVWLDGRVEPRALGWLCAL